MLSLVLFVIWLFVPLPPTFTAPKDSAGSASLEYRYYYLTKDKKRVGAFSKGCKVPVGSKVRVFPFVWGHVQVQKKEAGGDWINSQVSLDKKHQFKAPLKEASVSSWQQSSSPGLVPWTTGTKYKYFDADGNVSDPSVGWITSQTSTFPKIQLGKNATEVQRQVNGQDSPGTWTKLQGITIDQTDWTFVDKDNPASTIPVPRKPEAPTVTWQTISGNQPWLTSTQYAVQFEDKNSEKTGPMSDFTAPVMDKTKTNPVVHWTPDSKYRTKLFRKINNGASELIPINFGTDHDQYVDNKNPTPKPLRPAVVKEWANPIYCPCGDTKGWFCDTSTGLCVKRSQSP